MRLTPNGVDLWRLELDDATATATTATATGPRPELLSDDELARAARGATTAVRDRWVVRRAWLRTVLAHYTGRPPAALRFEYGAFGKPRLAGSGALHFNASSSGDWAVIAVAGAPVGIDVETIRSLPDAEGLTRRYLSAQGPADGARPGADPADLTFLRRWTCHEAVTKAIGAGLAADGGSYAVSWHTAGAPALTSLVDDDPSAWTLATPRLHPALLTTVAVRLRDPVLTVRPLGGDLECHH